MSRWSTSVFIALAINLLLAAAASTLVREPERARFTTPRATVSLVNLRLDDAPVEETAPEPPKPPTPPPPMDFAPDVGSPSLTAPTLSGPAVRLDPRLFGRAAPLSNPAFEAADLDRPPRAVVRTAPEYPYRARQRRIEGTLRVRFLVHADGRTSDVTILHADPPQIFDRAVIDAVDSWRFEPGMLAGEAVAAWVEAPITFDLDR